MAQGTRCRKVAFTACAAGAVCGVYELYGLLTVHTRVVALFTCAFAVACSLLAVYRWYVRRERRRRMAREGRRAASPRGPNVECREPPNPGSAVPNTSAVQPSAPQPCCVCFVNKRDCLVVPCRHLGMCQLCAARVNRCPVCRTLIDQRIRVVHAPALGAQELVDAAAESGTKASSAACE